MKIIVGLGNPGEQYHNTRHNIGWLALDELFANGSWQENKKFNSFIQESGNFLCVKPQTFMNNSGQAVQKILNYYKLLPKNFGLIKKKGADLSDSLIVIHDDLDLTFGTIKISTDSTSAGHRGVQSIIDYLQTKKFTRIRLGIKNDLLRTHIPPEKFVVQPFNHDERAKLKDIFTKINLENLK